MGSNIFRPTARTYDKGWYVSDAALQVQWPDTIGDPTVRAGWYAIVDTASANAEWRIWDVDQNKWIVSAGGPGDFSGPAGSVSGNFVSFADVSGKLGADSGYSASSFAPAAEGVTNGNSHDHSGGDGAQIDHTTLSNIGSNAHSTIDTHLGSTSNPHTVTAAQVGAATTATKLDDFATPDDNTDLNVSTTYHGLCPKLSNNAATWLDGTGVWSAPTAAEVGALANIVEDTTPQLGGNLDCQNTYNLTGVNAITMAPSGTINANGSNLTNVEKLYTRTISPRSSSGLEIPAYNDTTKKILDLRSYGGSRYLRLDAPADASATDPFIWNTANALKFQVDAADVFEITSSGDFQLASGKVYKINGTQIALADLSNGAAHDHTSGAGATIPITGGGSGQTTRQAAIDALTAVSGATNEHVLTKDTATGYAVWKAAVSGIGSVSEDTTPQLGGDLDLAEHSISYDLPDADGEYTGMISTQTVDTNTNGVGNVGILAADGHFDDADADAASTGGGEIVLVCESGTGSKKVLHDGWMYKSDWGFSPSVGPAYVDTGNGLLTSSAPDVTGDVVKIAGYFYSVSGTSGLLRFKPEAGYVEIL